jgi:hypothetical protein
VTSRLFRGRERVATQLREGLAEAPRRVSTESPRRPSRRPASAALRG